MELFFKERKMADITIECNRYIASPGFIDIQLNGGFKYDFSSFSNPNEAEKGLQFVSKELLEYGVTAYCPTLVSCSKEYYNMVSCNIMTDISSISRLSLSFIHLSCIVCHIYLFFLDKTFFLHYLLFHSKLFFWNINRKLY
jgi:N-acetylglucosamine-6-phosphate deacetylase